MVFGPYLQHMKKTVLITGASTGFGKATAELFLARGWNVVATMRTPHDVPGAFVTPLDVVEPASVQAAVAAGIDRFGRIDVVVNNAGYGLYGVFEQIPDAKLREQLEVNVFGVMNVTRAILPHFRAKRAGSFVNVSSGAGVFGLPMASAYNASKFALEGFSEALSYELAGLGIRVKLVEPGGVLSTRFMDRSGAEGGFVTEIADYGPFVESSIALFEGLKASRGAGADATSEHVAEVIYEAAVDETDRLRWVATQNIEALVRARRETSETEYMATMRAAFTPPKA